MIKNKRAIIAWSFYDWANSAFPTLIITFIFATYFTKAVAINPIIGTSQWANAIALSGVIIAVLAPVLGTISDNEGRRKPWLGFFTLLCIIPTALLWFVKPHPHYVNFALSCVVIATTAFELGMVFYNSMLNDLAVKTHLGRLSGWAWGLGYLGGLCGLMIALFAFVDRGTPVRIVGPFVALWYALFAWPLFLYTPDRPSTGIGIQRATFQGILQLGHTLKNLLSHKNIALFLLARMLYTDGLNTIFSFGGIYAAGTFGMSFSQVIAFGIAMNVGAGIGAAIFAWLDDYKGAKLTILITLMIMISSGTGMLLVHSQISFWILGMILSLCVGPVQASSRSLMIRIAPPESMTEIFGLYALSGKITAFLGPWVLGIVTLAFNSQRLGMGTVMIFLSIGALLLLLVKTQKNNDYS